VGGRVRNGYAILVRKSWFGGRIIEVYLRDLYYYGLIGLNWLGLGSS
jgi:hypothetical protein